MSRNQRRNFDVDYSEGGAIVPANRLQNMLQQVQQQGGIVNQQQGNLALHKCGMNQVNTGTFPYFK